MVRCSHQGCGAEFDASTERVEGECSYHSGGPVFHEGLKSWSCCAEVNKPVLDFESFMAMPGCTKGTHTTVVPAKPSPPTSTPTSTSATSISSNGVETYGIPATSKPSTPAPDSVVASSSKLPAIEKKEPEEEKDDPNVPAPEGARCRRPGCGFVRGSGEKDCVYHPGGPIFHEGSKGYSCCKPRVLEFDRFLSLEGCRTAKYGHLFVGAKKEEGKVEIVDCRMDHYQTRGEVIVSAFAKGVDKERSKVTFESEHIHLDLHLPNSKRVTKSISLYGPIDPESSTYKVMGTKVELILKKSSALSWSLLAKPEGGAAPPPGYALTFGVGGRTGTVGGKEIVTDQSVRSA